MADKIRINGLTQLNATLRQLPERLERNAILGALRAAGQVIRKDAMSRVPVLSQPHPHRKPGTVRRNITVKRSRKARNSVYVGVAGLGRKSIAAFKAVGGKKGANNPDDPFYWIFLEFGTAKMPAKPFLRPAFEAKKFEALRRFEEYLKKRLVKEALKLAREQGMRQAA